MQGNRTNVESTINNALYSLLSSVHGLGVEYPQLLIQLASILEPNISTDLIVPSLKKMFEELPAMLQQKSPQVLQKLLLEPSGEPISWKLMADFRELQQLLQQISFLQLLHLSNNLIPPGPFNAQLEFLLKAQEQFQAWTQETIGQLHSVLSDTPLHMERQQLLQLEPQIPWELLHFLIELLKLPIEELCGLQEWISKLPLKLLTLVLNLLLLEPSGLIEIKRRIDIENNSNSNNSSHSSLGGSMDNELSNNTSPIGINYNTNTGELTPIDSISMNSSNSSIVNNNKYSGYISDPTSYQLRIVRQPPSRTVYQRILKPFPSVMLVGGPNNLEQLTNSNLFVEATLLKSDSEAELPLCMEGNRIVRISNGVFATFKKLKILSTSQQQGTLFRLKFTLKRYIGNVFEQIPSAVAITNPIEVFSHTLYLSDKQEAPPPVVYEILPPNGKGGTRVVILGTNFVNSPNLRVRFGNTEVTPTFHEQGTLICTVPTQLKPELSGIPVRISNDSISFCETKVLYPFIYMLI
jgi:hypothetical protein